MSADSLLSEHELKLRRVYFHPNFSRYFELTTHSLSGAQQLKLKRTLTRQFQPCEYTWDLRANTNETCFVFTLHDRLHLLSFRALNVYYQLLPQYHYQYCRGLYEALLAHLPERNTKKTPSLSSPFLASIVPFGLRIERD